MVRSARFNDGNIATAVPGWSARVANRLGALSFAVGIGPSGAATLEVRGHKSGRMISFPVVVADYRGERYLVAMLGQKTNWARNLRAGDGQRSIAAPSTGKRVVGGGPVR